MCAPSTKKELARMEADADMNMLKYLHHSRPSHLHQQLLTNFWSLILLLHLGD